MNSDARAVEKGILEHRARMLARKLTAESDRAKEQEVVVLRLASERYAVGSKWVREVQVLDTLTPVPCTPPFVRGMINVRGQVVSVLDIKHFLGLPDTARSDSNRAVILRSDRMEFAILADAVLGTRPLSGDDLQPPPRTGSGGDYLQGVTADGLILLDASRILGDTALVVQDHVRRAGVEA